jgi:hypothetical protein
MSLPPPITPPAEDGDESREIVDENSDIDGIMC